jgi:hypothetical protein
MSLAPDVRSQSVRSGVRNGYGILEKGYEKMLNSVHSNASPRKRKKPQTLADSRLPEWTGPGLNRRPKDFQSFALPTELPVPNNGFTGVCSVLRCPFSNRREPYCWKRPHKP